MWSRPDPESFDAFYRRVRGPLLHQTYALTGDLSASQKAVRDALVVAWHHWRKVSRLEDPDSWVRPLAWARAQHRHTTRWWVRQRGISEESAATLDALGRLSSSQRRVLLLNHLVALPLETLGRETGLTQAVAESELQKASAQFALHRDVPTTSIRLLLDRLAADAAEVRWPRTTIITRAGSARRRSHTAAGVAAAVAALVVSGTVVGDVGGVRPDLDAVSVLDRSEPTSAPEPSDAPESEPEPDPLPETALLKPPQVRQTLGGAWREDSTTHNTEGDGLLFTCQGARYADPRGVAALFRTFSGKQRGTVAGQAVEVSGAQRSAERTFDRTLRWYAACETPRVQLLDTLSAPGLGDESRLVVLRRWGPSPGAMVVGVARTGTLTTTTVLDVPGGAAPSPAGAGRMLASAVNGLCKLPGGGACARTARLKPTAPMPVRPAPSLLQVLDLPPVPGVTQPWAATRAQPARENLAATRCDQADFQGAGISRAMTRSFVIDARRLPPEFGMTQTVGAMSARRAQIFVDQVRRRLAACPDKDLATRVTPLADEGGSRAELAAWRLTVDVSDERQVTFLMAIVRTGGAVSQVTLVPTGADVSTTAFVDIARRAQQRLPALTAPTA